jgi:arylformamidase
MEIFDVSIPVRSGMPVYPGDPEVRLERVSESPAVSRLDFGVHTGTHVDAPLHFIDGGAGTEELRLELLVGPCEVVEGLDLGGVEPGSYELYCLPLRLVGSDGAPARAILVRR